LTHVDDCDINRTPKSYIKQEDAMDQKGKQIPVMECSLSYSLSDQSGQVTASGEARARVDEESLAISPEAGEALFFSLRDILEISEADYKIHLPLSSREGLTLFNVGYQYQDLLRNISQLRNEMLLKDILMNEKLRKSGVQAEFVYFDETGKEKQRGKCEPRLYETGIVLMPEKGELTRIPYSDISEFRGEDYTFTMTSEFGEKLILSKMASQFDPFRKILSDSINQLALRVQSWLKELLPEADPTIIRKAARFMREGRAAKRSDIESLSSELWKRLEMRLEVAGLKEEYGFLKSLSQQEKICIGFKRGLLGDLAEDYIWFLIPIYSTNSQEPGNAVAMEAASEDGSGKATYFFRIVSRKDYPALKSIQDMHREVDNFIKVINRCMLAINFRREPIYLSDERLADPQYTRYKFAIQKLQALQTLRSLFIGRVIHSSLEQWKQDVADLLKFNVTTLDDSARWAKAMAGPEAIDDIAKPDAGP
jgi:hypothetical protein